MSADRDLLFGLIALQNGLIDQAQLVAAFQAWARRKDRPLAEVLLERGDLRPDDRDGVEAMVALHLRRHGDAERSLASLPVGRSTRARIEGLKDPDLNATIARAGADAETATPDSDATVTYAVGAATADGQRFRVLRPHARGGLGAVFVALDAELNREVALKRILDGHADDPGSRRRFLAEAEITGGLEHPGIVPVYGLGTHGDGRPYYAMRFIRGDSLKEAVDRFHADPALKSDPGRRSLELRKLLRRFLDVCNAVEYAHSRGVLHRDIKPSNIIVGKHGETLVVDWGLAKATGRPDPAVADGERTLVPSSSSGSAETLPGQALGTPAYMSPEQARGDLGRLGPRSDVYSLGATLYYLLTGKPAFDGELADLLRKVERGEFPPPRQLDPAIDRALEAVCLKAMANRPEDRYPSCRALAEDVERWTADEPVLAWREPWWRRGRRWLVRHRALVGGLLIAGPAVILSLVAVVAHERLTNVALDQKNQDLEEARRAAEAARLRAEGREDLALRAIDSYRDMVEKNPDLLTRPELGELRNRLLQAPRDFYRQLKDALEREKAEGAADSGLDDKLMQANFALAWANAERGTQAEALNSYREAAAILESLVRRADVPDRRRILAILDNNVGNILIDVGRFDEAREALDKAQALREALIRERPEEPDPLTDLAVGELNLGRLDGIVGRSESALAHARRAVALYEEVVGLSPAQDFIRGEQANALLLLGDRLAAVGRTEEARAALRRAVALMEPLVAAKPDHVVYRSRLAELLTALGQFVGRTEARDCLARAIELGETTVPDLSGLPLYRSKLATSLRLAGDHARRWEEFDEAIAAQRRAVEIGESLARDFTEVIRYRIDLADGLTQLGMALADAGRATESLPLYDRASPIYAEVVRAYPEDIGVGGRLAVLLNNRGLALAKLGRHEEAVAAFREAIARERACLDRDPLSSQYRSWLSWHYMGLGRSLRALGRKDEALAASRARFELLDGAPPEQRERELHYHFVCDFAQLVPLVGGGKPDAELSEAERAERQSYADCAVEEFRLALADGFIDLPLFANDTDLDPIRSRPDFRRLLDGLMDRAFPADPFAR